MLKRRLHGAFRDTNRGRNLLVRSSFEDSTKHLALALGQGTTRLLPRCPRDSRRAGGPQPNIDVSRHHVPQPWIHFEKGRELLVAELEALLTQRRQRFVRPQLKAPPEHVVRYQ